MLMRSVVQDQVHDHAEPATVSILKECIEVIKRAKARVNIDVIAHVIAEIMHGRWIDGGQPDRVHPERGRSTSEIIEPGPDTAEVADTVIIGVLKTPRIDLIENGGLPPGRNERPRRSRHYRGGQ